MVNSENLNVNLFINYSKCNFDCPYCYQKDKNIDISKEYNDNLRKSINVLGSIKKTISITIEQNGELFLSPYLKEFVISLSKTKNINAINFYTNLGVREDDLSEFTKKVEKNKIALCCTYHPLVYKNYEGFKKKLMNFRNAGICVAVIVVAYPPALDSLRKYKDDFDSLAVPLTILAFDGDFEGRRYPESYSEKEINYLKELYYSADAFNYNLLRKRTKGMPCTSGVSSVSISPDGDVFACRQDWILIDPSLIRTLWASARRRVFRMKPKFYLGNILKSGFRLLESHRCPHETCTCEREFPTLVDFNARYEKSRNILEYKLRVK